MKKRSVFSICLLLIIVMTSGSVFSGCRRSEVLEQKIYTEKQEIDWQNETKIKNNEEENLQEDQEIASKKETEDAQTERSQTDSQPVRGDGDNGSAPILQYGESAPQNGEVQESDEGIEQGTDTADAGIEDVPEILPSTSGDLQTVDDNGENLEIPDSYSKVAAAGPAAAFVEMFGGSGKLKASSESFINNSAAQSVFSDLAEVQTIWPGDGSTVISDDGISQLINLLSSDNSGKGTCLYDTGMLNGEQVKALNEAGIDTWPISLAQNSSSSYKEQVMAIGEILGDEAVRKAKEYCDWYDEVIRIAKSNAPDEIVYTLYVSEWDENVSWMLQGTAIAQQVQQSGLAVAALPKNAALFNDYLNQVNVTNRAQEMQEILYQDDWYINPFLPGTYNVEILNPVKSVLKDQRINKLTSKDTEGIYLGSQEFPAVVVADSLIRDRLIDNQNMEYGMWKVYKPVVIDGRNVYGFLTDDNKVVETTIHDEYQILTLPQGISGNWASGTPEGVLSAIWAGCRIRGSIGESDLAAQLKSFYSEFCGVSLNDNQISSILAG